VFLTVLRIRIRWPGSGSAKISIKNCKKKFLLQNPKSELLKKEIIKISSFLDGSSSFRIKISEKIKKKI